MMPIKITEEQALFLRTMATCINHENHNWFYMPFSFKQVGENTFEVIQFEKLPEHFISFIKLSREISDL